MAYRSVFRNPTAGNGRSISDQLPFDQVVHYDGYENYMIALFEQATCIRTIWVHNDMEREIQAKGNPSLPLLKHAYATYDHVVPVGEDIRPAVERIGSTGQTMCR